MLVEVVACHSRNNTIGCTTGHSMDPKEEALVAFQAFA